VACFWSILGTGIFGNFGTGRGRDFPVYEWEFPVALMTTYVINFDCHLLSNIEHGIIT